MALLERSGATVDLDFDAAGGFHTYAIEWTPDAVRWFVEDQLEHVDTAADGQLPTPPGASSPTSGPTTV